MKSKVRNKIGLLLLLITSSFGVFGAAPSSVQANYQTTSTTINSNTGIFSNGTVLWMGSDGNLALYYTTGGWSARWWTGTNTPGSRAVLQSDGNLVVYSPANQVMWHSNTWGNSGATYMLQDDGNFSIFSITSAVLFTTNTSRSPTSGSTPAGAAPFAVKFADSSGQSHITIDVNAPDVTEWQWRFDGAGAEVPYEPTDMNIYKVDAYRTYTDVAWYVQDIPGNDGGGEAWCHLDLASDPVNKCDQRRIRIDDTAVDNTSHMQNNLVCHEFGHSVGLRDGGTIASTCMTGGDNTQLRWWEINQINGKY